MRNLIVIIGFVVVFFGIIGVVIWKYYSAEKQKRDAIRDSFKRFSERKDIGKSNLRAVERLIIPELLSVILTLTDDAYFGLKAQAIDVSENGFSVKPDFPLRKLPIGIELNNVLVKTPLNNFVVDKIKTVRYEHEVNRRVLAFKILSVDKKQKEKFSVFINYLNEYLKEEGYVG